MRGRRLLFAFFLALGLLAAVAVAQNNNGNNNNNGGSTTTAAANTASKTTNAAPSSKTTNAAPSSKTTTNAAPSSTAKPASTSQPPSTKSPATTTDAPLPKATSSTSSKARTSKSTDAPLPKASSSTDAPLPKLFTTPVVTPPPAGKDPWLRSSTLPEGTVFIAVGAGLAFLALVVAAWRGLVAWSLHRSVARAATQSEKRSLQHPAGGNPSGNGGFYAVGPGSTLSLDNIARSPNPQPPRGSQYTPNTSSLFFSPTSAAAAAGPGGGDRRNAYLPAGFYAAGATAGKRNSSATLGAPSFVASHQNRDSGSSRGGFYNNGRGVSPPGSPMLAPGSRGGGSERGSTMLRVNDSQTSLNVAPTGRAPSAYLEDLFESHGQGRF